MGSPPQDVVTQSGTQRRIFVVLHMTGYNGQTKK